MTMELAETNSEEINSIPEKAATVRINDLCCMIRENEGNHCQNYLIPDVLKNRFCRLAQSFVNTDQRPIRNQHRAVVHRNLEFVG
jgi:hypothetical protein